MLEDKKHRRLAAIMFTDIVGYTALMQQNEAAATAVRTRHRTVFNQQHELHNGEILQYFGDGTLSVFESGVKAVECAIAIQLALQEGESIPLRIGLHTGDIVFDGTDIYGDSVNLASRIESMGIAGGVLLSEKLNDDIKNHQHISTNSLGAFEFKNIARPVEVFSVTNTGIKTPKHSELKGKQKMQNKTIAVLPFVNMSASQDNEYFSDGMTEEIINALAKISALKVTSRTSSFFFKNKNIPIPQIGQELNVSTILEGSIRLAGNKMRITAQLIDVKNDFHFWSETFDRSMDDIFAVQDEISLLIADKLREHIGHFDIDNKLVDTPNIPVEDYKKYLRARFLLLKMGKIDLEEGINLLKEIIATQPNFPLAYLGVHLGYTLLGTMGFVAAEETFIKGQPFLDKAIELDESLPECQLHLSYQSFIQQWDLKTTYQHLNKSLAIRPTVEYYQFMASILATERKFSSALNYIETAIQIDPFSSINHHLKGFIFYTQGKYKQAIELFDKSISLQAGFVAPILYKGQTLLLMGQAEEALAYFQQLPDDLSEDLMKLGGTTMAYAALGNDEQTKAGIEKLTASLETNLKGRAVSFLILCNAIIENKAETLQFIEQGISGRFPMTIFLYSEPILKPLHSNTQFQALMRQMLGDDTDFDLTLKKYKRSLLDRTFITQYKQQLESLMAQDKPHLDPNLTLRDLANFIGIHPNQLSQLLNEGFDKNFAEYVNSYRLETFKSMVADPAFQHLTILGLAFDSGFNSKTVFNTFFKKTMGITPKAYWKKIAR